MTCKQFKYTIGKILRFSPDFAGEKCPESVRGAEHENVLGLPRNEQRTIVYNILEYALPRVNGGEYGYYEYG